MDTAAFINTATIGTPQSSGTKCSNTTISGLPWEDGVKGLPSAAGPATTASPVAIAGLREGSHILSGPATPPIPTTVGMGGHPASSATTADLAPPRTTAGTTKASTTSPSVPTVDRRSPLGQAQKSNVGTIATCRQCGKPKSKHPKGRWCQKEELTVKDRKERAAKNRDSKQREQKRKLDELVGSSAEEVLKKLEILPMDDPVAKKEEEKEAKTKEEAPVTVHQRISIASLFSHVKRDFYMTPNLLAKTPVQIPNIYGTLTASTAIKAGASILFGLIHSRVVSYVTWPHLYIFSTIGTSLLSTYFGLQVVSNPFVATGQLFVQLFPWVKFCLNWADFFIFARYAYNFITERTNKYLPEIQLASKVTFNNPDFSEDPDLRTDAESVRKATHDSAIVATVDHTYSMHSALRGSALAVVPEIPIIRVYSIMGLSISLTKSGLVLHDTIRTHSFSASLEMASQLLGPSVTEVSTPMDDVWNRMSYATRGVGLIMNNRFDPLSVGEMPLLGSQLLAYHVSADYRERIMHVPVPGRSPAP